MTDDSAQTMLEARRVSDLVTSRKDQPTTWTRLSRAFATLCEKKRTGESEASEIARLTGELQCEAWKVAFQIRKWKAGLANLREVERRAKKKRKRQEEAAEEEAEEMDRELRAAAEDLESGRAVRRAYDRRVALQKACAKEGSLEELEKTVNAEKRIVENLEKEQVALEASFKEAEKKKKAVLLCADEVRWGCAR